MRPTQTFTMLSRACRGLSSVPRYNHVLWCMGCSVDSPSLCHLTGLPKNMLCAIQPFDVPPATCVCESSPHSVVRVFTHTHTHSTCQQCFVACVLLCRDGLPDSVVVSFHRFAEEDAVCDATLCDREKQFERSGSQRSTRRRCGDPVSRAFRFSNHALAFDTYFLPIRYFLAPIWRSSWLLIIMLVS